MTKCIHCNKAIVLNPSAQERAEKYGKTAKYYSDLFTEHEECRKKTWYIYNKVDYLKVFPEGKGY